MKTLPNIERFLESSLQSSRNNPPLAVFDCDGTLIKGDIGEAMFYFQLDHFLFRESPARLWPDHPQRAELQEAYESLLRVQPHRSDDDRRFTTFANLVLSHYFNQLGEGKTEKACSDIVRLFSGFKTSEVMEIAADTLRFELQAPIGRRILGEHVLPAGIRYFREVKTLVQRLQELGFDIRVISGSNRWSVEEVCRPLLLEPDKIIGIDLEVRGGFFSDDVVNPVPVRDGKVHALEASGLRSPEIVVSDSTYDLPLFQYSGGLKVLIRSNDSGEKFFEHTGVTADDSWVVIAPPTLDT